MNDVVLQAPPYPEVSFHAARLGRALVRLRQLREGIQVAPDFLEYKSRPPFYPPNIWRFEEDEMMDVVRTFFVECWAFKETANHDNPTWDAEGFVDKHRELMIAVDVGNRFKHPQARRAPRSGRRLEVLFGRADLRRQRPGEKFATFHLNIQVDGQEYDGYEIAEMALAQWNDFLQNIALVEHRKAFDEANRAYCSGDARSAV